MLVYMLREGERGGRGERSIFVQNGVNLNVNSPVNVHVNFPLTALGWVRGCLFLLGIGGMEGGDSNSAGGRALPYAFAKGVGGDWSGMSCPVPSGFVGGLEHLAPFAFRSSCRQTDATNLAPRRFGLVVQACPAGEAGCRLI